MNFDITARDNNQDYAEDDEINTSMRHLLSESAATGKHDIKELAHKNATLSSATLLLPTPMNGPKTTSTKLAEKSYIWSENKLHDMTSDLDKQLYQSMVKMNSDRLEIVRDLAKLKRSSSTGTLSSFEAEHHGKLAQEKPRSQRNSPVIKRKDNQKEIKPPLASRSSSHGAEKSNKHLDWAAGIEIRITSDAGSEFEELHDHNYEHLRCMSSTSARRHCSEERSQADMVENVLRRYARQTRPKSARD